MHGTTGAPVTLSGCGGLVTLAKPESVPEGASPRTYDTDFNVGSCGSRPGLANVYGNPVAEVGPNAPTAAASSSWTNPGNILATDGSYASFAPIGSANSIVVTDFVFDIPSTTSITGVYFTVNGYANTPCRLSAQLVVAGVPSGDVISVDLTISPAAVTFGAVIARWGLFLTAAQVNALNFGVKFSASSSSFPLGTAFLDSVAMIVGVNPGTANFQFITTMTAQDGTVRNLSMDSNGNLYVENVTHSPGVLTLALEGLTANSYAVGVNGPDVEYLAITDLSTGSDTPLQYTPNWIDRITQVGPGAAPSFSPVIATSNTYPIATITQFPQQSTNRSGTPGGGDFVALLWSAGPGNQSAGTTVTVYYLEGPAFGNPVGDPDLIEAFNSGVPVYVYITGAGFGNGTQRVTSIGVAGPPQSGDLAWYFTFNMPTANYAFEPSFPAGQYQLTVGTLTTAVPVPGLSAGNQVTIAGASVGAWDNTWPITKALNSAQLTITETSVAGFVATYSWNLTTGTPPVAGQLVNVTGTTNANGLLNGANLTIATSTAYGGVVDVSGTAVTWVSGDQFTALVPTGTMVINGANYQILTVNSATSATLTASAGTQTGVPYNAGTITSGTFTVVSTVASAPATPEDGLATTAGTIFLIDPGTADVGTGANPILGNSVGGTLTYVGSSAQLISPGTKQGSVFFITRNGYYTCPAPPVTFTIPENTIQISASNLPIGPPNVIGRGIVLTESGSNGVPGANFYTLPTPVQYTVNNISYTASSFIVNDNTTASVVLTFTDSVLLNAEAVDVYGYNLFNQIEIGDPGWVANYDSRNWYGKCINKVQNFNNLSFDGGYLSGQTTPLGWTAPDVFGALVTSPKFGDAYYILNATGSSAAVAGMISQTAYQDAYQQPIINGNTAYSVRVTCSNPSGIQAGSLVISLTAGGVTYGSFTLPFSAMVTNLATYSGTLLVNQLQTVPAELTLNVFATNIGPGADVLIDRIEPVPTDIPILTTTVFASYAGLPEQVDAITGQVKFESENQQPVNGAMVLYDTLYALKGWGGTNPGSSLYSLQKSSNLEPAQWDEPEVAQRSGGAIGPLAFDLGEQWFLSASRAGLYLFVGGQPGKISQEIYQVWDAINWTAGNTIWLKVDITQRKIYIGIPLPTPNFWLPNAPVNANPTSPNVILMCNYQGIDSGEQLKIEPQMHTTMFGALNAIDMRRKWSLWQIPAPYANFVASPTDEEFYICNGRSNSKIYRLDPTMETDDGLFIDSLYTTAGLVELSKRQQTPGAGNNRMRWGYMSAALETEGTVGVTLYPNRLIGPGAVPDGYNAWTLPGGFSPGKPALNDAEAPLNFAATRTYFEFRENDGHGFTLSNLALSAKADPWNKLRGAK